MDLDYVPDDAVPLEHCLECDRDVVPFYLEASKITICPICGGELESECDAPAVVLSSSE